MIKMKNKMTDAQEVNDGNCELTYGKPSMPSTCNQKTAYMQNIIISLHNVAM